MKRRSGWYPYPQDESQEQYWDGQAWVGEVRGRAPLSRAQLWYRKNQVGLAILGLLLLAAVIILY
jgi:hypothetical protein